MSYTANQYNYCTPLSSATGFTDASSNVADKKYFTLHDSKLDGSFFPVTGDVGLWGTSVADSAGVLTAPFVVTVEGDVTLQAIVIAGSQYSFPVDFTVEFYSGDSLIDTLHVTGNSSPTYIGALPEVLDVTKYAISVTRISSPGSVARLSRSFKAFYVASTDRIAVQQISYASVMPTVRVTDNARVAATDAISDASVHTASIDAARMRSAEVATIINRIGITRDRIAIKHASTSTILNRIDVARDTLKVHPAEAQSHVRVDIPTVDTLRARTEDTSVLYNVHTVMKAAQRRIYGKVYITYTDPLLDNTVTLETSTSAYNSGSEQMLDSVQAADGKFFTLFDNNLSGAYTPSSAGSQVGWTSSAISDSDGYFAEPPYIEVSFSARPITALTLFLDDSHGCLAEDFTVTFTKSNGTSFVRSFTGNTLVEVPLIDEAAADIVSVNVSVTRVSKAHHPVTILDLPVVSTVLYAGYQDESHLVSIDLLEELTYEDDVEALGGVSANEVTVVLDNSDKVFNITSSNSPIAKQLKRNRKIVPWLGAELAPGIIEWYSLGTFWSYSWDVPYGSLTASVTGFDTIGLLGVTSYTDHQVLVDKSIGFLIDYVLTDAKKQLSFLEWSVAPELYNVSIPYAWFEHGSHAAALRRISQAYPMHIYCNRQGRVVAAPQKLRLDYHNDVWSDSTNVIDKTYSSLYTVLPNIINITVINPAVTTDEQIASDELTFDVSLVPDRTLNFSAPYVNGLVVTIDKDETVSYTYEAYSWGIDLHFTGTGKVRSILCTGSALDMSNTSQYTRRDQQSILVNGAVTRDISADFIQTSALAVYLADRLVDLAKQDIYDAEVTYRGDIALTINDSILLLDGIAPDNRYNIKRHQLTWDGGLTGIATLNT